MPERDEDGVAVAAVVQQTAAQQRLLVHERDVEIGIHDQQRAAEFWRRDADDRERMFVELNSASYYGRIVVEAGMPIRVAEDSIGRAIHSVLIGAMKKAPAVWLQSEH